MRRVVVGLEKKKKDSKTVFAIIISYVNKSSHGKTMKDPYNLNLDISFNENWKSK